LRTQVVQRNHVLDGVQIPVQRDSFEDGRAAHCKVYCHEPFKNG